MEFIIVSSIDSSILTQQELSEEDVENKLKPARFIHTQLWKLLESPRSAISAEREDLRYFQRILSSRSM